MNHINELKAKYDMDVDKETEEASKNLSPLLMKTLLRFRNLYYYDNII